MRTLAGGLPLAAAALILLNEPSAASFQNSPSFRAGTDLVSLNVTVTEGGTTRYVSSLGAGEFEVFEDGVKQDVSFFNNANSPVALALLLDTSASMDIHMRTAQEAAIGFARKVRQQDMAAVIDFDDRVTIGQPFTNDVSQLEKAIRKTSAGGSTRMFNAIYIALSELRKLASDELTRRQAIVLLSDGEDTGSMLAFDGPDGILETAKRSDTAIYAVGLRTAEDAKDKGFKQPEFVLRQLAVQTGGRAFFPEQIAELANVYGQIAEELSNQYVLRYTSKNTRRDGAWRRIVIRMNRTDLVARTRQGYFAPTH